MTIGLILDPKKTFLKSLHFSLKAYKQNIEILSINSIVDGNIIFLCPVYFGLCVVCPFGHCIVCPLDHYVVCAFGHCIVCPFGHYVVCPIGHCIVCPFGYCVFCPFPNYGFWLPLWCLQYCL